MIIVTLNLQHQICKIILVKRTITVPNTAAEGAAVDKTDNKVIFKNRAPSTNCITKINNT